MPLNFYLAYGEGDFASTAGGVFMGLVVLTLGCLAFIFLLLQNLSREPELNLLYGMGYGSNGFPPPSDLQIVLF